MPPARGLQRQLRTDRRVRTDLADPSLPGQLICLTAFRRAAGLWLETKPARGHAARQTREALASNITLSEQASGQAKHGTASLVTREGAAALERESSRLYMLVHATRPVNRQAPHRPPRRCAAVT